jgi:hypothetical protein
MMLMFTSLNDWKSFGMKLTSTVMQMLWRDLWADDLEVAVPKMPVLTKAEAVKVARSGRMKFLRYRTSDIRVRVYDNAAVVTGRLQRTRSTTGQEISDDWRFTKTYVREAGQWRVVSFHASEAAQP